MSLTSPRTGAQTYGPSPQVPSWQISSSSLEISGSSSWSEVKQANHPASTSISLSTIPPHHCNHYPPTSGRLYNHHRRRDSPISPKQ